MKDDTVYPEGVELYDFEDHDTHRNLIFDNVKNEIIKNFPQSHNGVRVELHDVDYVDTDDPDYAMQKKAILENKYLTKRLRGRVRLVDEITGDPLDEKHVTLMQVPYLTERGTFIHGGNEYAAISQSRLLPGAYTRRQRNGELETQFNVRSGSGSAFRVSFEPSSSQYRMRVQNANLHLYSLLKDLGVPDEHLEKSWGSEILAANRSKYDSRVLGKAYQRMVSKWDQNPDSSKEEKAMAIKNALEASQIHERVAKRNLPNMFDMNKVAEWREAGERIEKSARESEDKQAFILPDDRWMAKVAALSMDDTRALAKFLNTKHAAGLDINADLPNLERQVMDFIENDQSVNPAVLAAGIQGLEDVQDQMKMASSPTPTYIHTPVIPVLVKMARYGAGILFKQPNGKYLLQENDNGDLRPAGGGKETGDTNLRSTILREVYEEFGIPQDESSEKITLLGYNTVKGPFRDCAVFQMEDHGLKPGVYTTDVSTYERVKLVEAELDDPRYVGPKLTQLRRYALRGYRGRGTKTASEEKFRDLTTYEAEGYKISSDIGIERSVEVDLEVFGDNNIFEDEFFSD